MSEKQHGRIIVSKEARRGVACRQEDRQIELFSVLFMKEGGAEDKFM